MLELVISGLKGDELETLSNKLLFIDLWLMQFSAGVRGDGQVARGPRPKYESEMPGRVL